jgi:hypothetical protein
MDKNHSLSYAVPMLNSLWKKVAFILLCLFALIGLIAVGAYVAIQFHLTNVSGIVDSQSRYLTASSTAAWETSPEWQALSPAIIKDQASIDQASQVTGIPSRLIVAQLVVEQLRLYGSDRELFKQIFEPLQILGVQSQYSWGVMGLKQETAQQIETNLKDATSTYYLGPQYEHLLDFSTNDPDTERFNRLTDQHDHYYSYLYAALFLKQIEHQWSAAGFDISNRPEILSTLFNIGFEHSTPNANPQVGGAEIDINGQAYSFGGLAYDFYQSSELIDQFPRN